MSRHATTLNDPLTPREAQVLASIVAGRQNKETARDLGISPRTVEGHRGNIMTKIGARTLADMVRIAIMNPPVVKNDDRTTPHHRCKPLVNHMLP